MEHATWQRQIINGIDITAQIHPLAFVDDSITVGARTRIWQFASVIRGTILGDDCNVASSATIDGPKFGNRCIISQGVAMGPGFDIEDDVFIGPNVTICNDRWPSSSKDNFDPEALRNEFITVRIKRGASIGANAVVLPGVTIGENAMVAAGAVATVDVPDDHVFFRNGEIIPIRPEWRQKRMRRVV